jgi:hypothetical protein
MEMRNEYRISIGNSGEKGSLGRPRRRWKNNVKMETGKS